MTMTAYDNERTSAERRAPGMDIPPVSGLQMRAAQATAAHAQSHAILQYMKRGPVQWRDIDAGKGEDTGQLHRAAAKGITGSGGKLPHLDAIQRSFGNHDVSAVQAHVGGQAAEASAAMGARAYATGNSVAFEQSPDLHTAAHEAAHIVQQRGGVSLKGGVGQVGDLYERHADAVADRVVQGKSAVDLLDSMGGSRAADASLLRPGAAMQQRGGRGGASVVGGVPKLQMKDNDGLASANAKDYGGARADFIVAYTQHLDEKLASVRNPKLDGRLKAIEIEATLHEVEIVSAELAAGRVPKIESLSPRGDKAMGAFVPPELIRPVRALIELLEAYGEGAEPEKAKSGVDWNSRLGVPQYRTQSDNLAGPEVTCSVTVLAMIFERLGYGRDDILALIKGRDATWDLKAKDSKLLGYLNRENKRSGRFRTLRGMKMEADSVVGQYAGHAQMEDLLDYVITGLMKRNRGEVSENAGLVLNSLKVDGGQRPRKEHITRGGKNDWKTVRPKIGATLANGGGVLMSIKHKGTGRQGTHIVSIQALTGRGAVLDDPFGRIRSTYDATKWGDAYAPEGSTDRTPAYKNQIDKKSPADWQAESTRNLKPGERLGASVEVPDIQLTAMWRYVVLFNRAGDASTDKATKDPPAPGGKPEL